MGDALIICKNSKIGNSDGIITLTSLIETIYPEGSICTCSNGENIITATNTSGRALFNADIGIWTVSCTDGIQSYSKEVNVTAEGQHENVELFYWDGTLYDSGNKYEDYTGGWTVSGESGWNASYMRPTSIGREDGSKLYVEVFKSSSAAYVRTTNLMTLTKGTVINATITNQTHSSSWSGNERCQLVISTKADLSSAAQSVKPSNSNAQTLTLTVSTTGDYYVGLYAKAGTASQASMSCSKIQLIY